MLKNRQHGLLFLHGFLLTFAVTALFGLVASICALSGFIRFNVDVNWPLYAIAVMVAMVWNHHALGGMIDRLPSLGDWQSARLAFHQVTRLMTVLFTLGFATQDVEMSRAFFALFIGLAAVLLFSLNRYLPKYLSRFLFRGLQLRTLVLAQRREVLRFSEWFDKTEHLGQQIIGWIAPGGEATADAASGPIPYLGSCEGLERLIADENANHLLVNKAHFSAEEVTQIEAIAEKYGCRFHFFVDLVEVFGSDVSALEQNQRYAFATHTNEPLDNPVNRFMKRALDLAISIPVVCLVLPPLTVLVWIMQRFESEGPVFHRQERSGLNRQRFHIFKFRTMHVRSSRADEARQATANDSRVFPFGRFMRRTSLDEFPQFLNVLLGQMSVSGPRPHLLEHDEQFAELVGSYYRRHFVKPGITGLAQSEGFRGEVLGPDCLHQRIAHDLHYVSRWSLLLDIKIIFATAWQIVFPPRAAY